VFVGKHELGRGCREDRNERTGRLWCPQERKTDTTSSGGPVIFLNLGRDYPDPERFTVVIWASDDERVELLQDAGIGRTVCAAGEVSSFKGEVRVLVDGQWRDGELETYRQAIRFADAEAPRQTGETGAGLR
jgi:hypothetical protein